LAQDLSILAVLTLNFFIMNYSLMNLTQVTDCDALLAWAAKEKANLLYQKTTDERFAVKYAETSQEIDANLISVLAQINASEITIASLPDGPTKEQELDKKTRLEYRKFVLESRKEAFGTIALLQKQTEVARVEQEIAEMDAFVATIQAHLLTIQ
jgi:hypothetical protein